MKIYDCFMLFNELDLLEIRLEELDPVVDYFVVVEATRTHQNRRKPLVLDPSDSRWANYAGKIRHVVLEKYESFWRCLIRNRRRPTAFDREQQQRDSITRGLFDADPDDLIIVSDIDEIPRREIVQEHSRGSGLRVCSMRGYGFFLNYQYADENFRWRGTAMQRFGDITSPHRVRFEAVQPAFDNERTVIIPDAGWHFSWLGGVDAVISKLEAFCHPKLNTPEIKNPDRIQSLIDQGRDIVDGRPVFKIVDIDSSFPRALQANPGRYAHLIRNPVAQAITRA